MPQTDKIQQHLQHVFVLSFCIGEVEDDDLPSDARGLSRGDLSHLVVWQVPIIRERKKKAIQ